MPGPPRVPTEILRMRGSQLLPKRGNEPRPVTGRPEMPDGLSEAVVEVWDQVCDHVAGLKILAESDGNAIERYCRLLVEWRGVQDRIDKLGTTYTLYAIDSKTGKLLYDSEGNKIIRYRQQHPEVGVRNKLSGELLKLEKEFGLTPASRASIEVTARDSNPNAAMLKFFGGAG